MWINKAYSRLLIDNHINDIDLKYMTKFDPKEYVAQVKKAGVESSMVYACDHNGNAYYPTKIGHEHKNLTRDIFGEVVKGLNEENIVPIAYYTVVFNNYFAKTYKETAYRDIMGNNHGGRYYYSCPNNAKARELYKEQIKEIIQYDIKGIFIDMTFWPGICLCDACKEKFGKEIPDTINWEDPKWVEFQRFREESVGEFAQELTDFVKSIRPDITVTHQFSPVLHGFFLGQSTKIAEACDYCSGDFYGDKIQQRLGIKIFDSYTTNKPFEFMTSRCVNLFDHTTCKSNEELILSALTTLANGGAYFFIDAINTDGTLEAGFYDRLKEVNDYLTPFRKVVKENQFTIKGKVGIYFSMTSCINEDLNNVKLLDFTSSSSNMTSRENKVLDETIGFAELFTEMHIPYVALTERDENFEGLDTIIICNGRYLKDSECDKLREFVKGGGNLIVTGATSLYDYEGNVKSKLSDVFGIEFLNKWSPSVNYTDKELICSLNKAPLVKATTGKVLAYFNFPDYPIGHEENYASIHSNPPGKWTEYPALVENGYGRGKSLWIGSDFMARRFYSQKEYCKKIISSYLPKDIETDLPNSVEITTLKGNEKEMIGVVNMQNQFPPIPIYNSYIKIKMQKPDNIIKASDNKEISWEYLDNFVKINIEKLEFGEFFIIK